MNETKKFPNAIRLPSGKVESERLLPFLKPTRQSGFLGLKNGKTYRQGMLVHLGISITAEDIYSKFVEFHPLPIAKEEFLIMLDKYIEALQSFKIGNVISIQYSEGGEFSISKVMEMPPFEKLPLP